MIPEDDDLPVLTQVLRTGGGRLPDFSNDGANDRASERADDGAYAGTRGSTRALASDARVDALDNANDEPSWPRALVIGSEPEPQIEGRRHPSHEGPQAHDPTFSRDKPGDADLRNAGAFFDAMPIAADPRRIDLKDNDVFLRSAPTETAFGRSFDEPPIVVRHQGADRDAADADEADGEKIREATASAAGRGSSASPASSITVSRDVPLVFRPASEADASDLDSGFALRVRDSVLQALSGRIDTELDARIAQTLHAELETALAHLQTRLRVELAEALRDVVGLAVDDAIRRLGTSSQIDEMS